MDFSVGIAVLVLVTVLVVAVIGYGIYLNRRHDQWENVVGHAATDTQSNGLGVSSFSAEQNSTQKQTKTASKSSRFLANRGKSKKAKRSKRSARHAPTVTTAQTKISDLSLPSDAPGLPHMSVEDVYRGGIPTSEGKIIKHEVKGKRAEVFGSETIPVNTVEKKVGEHQIERGAPISAEQSHAPAPNSETSEQSFAPLMEGIVGEVVKKPRDKTETITTTAHRWTKDNNAHVLQSSLLKSSSSKTPKTTPERVVPLRKGSTKVLANGASKARRDRANSTTDMSRLEEYVVLRVSGKHANAFPLRELARFMLNRSLKFDDIGLFSMHDDDTNELMFKVADVYSPGQFDRAQLETYCTEGLTFIMCLAPLANPQQSFEQMLSLASECARCFDAVVQDEHSNKLSNQTITHYRYRVADFRRKQMSM